MKPVLKLGSLLLAVLMAVAAVFSGCSLNKEWSYKSSAKELPVGVYIYCLSNAYSTAKSYAEKLEDYDSSKADWLDKEITDDDGNKAVARQWIKNKAQEYCLNFLAVEDQLVVETAATYDEATLTNYRDMAKQYWEVGVSQYGQQTAALKLTYEPFGVSLESFSYVYADANVKQEALFYGTYGKGGSKEVKDDELNEYFTDNYVSYSYLGAPLYSATTDEEGNSSNIALSDKKIEELKSEYEGYVSDIKNGKSLDDVTKAYREKNNDETAEPTTNTDHKDSFSMGDDFKAAVEKLDGKSATTLVVGEKENAMLYFIYKDDIKDVAKNYLKDGEQKKQVLAKMKSDEFKDYMKELVKELKYEKNSAVDGYDPKMFFEPVPMTTAEPTAEATEDEE